MSALEKYLHDLYEIRSTGAGVAETSYYPALSNLLNEIGAGLKPKVRCVINLQDKGAGLPDGGFFTPDQFQKGGDAPLQGQMPARGAMEMKPVKDDAWVTADGKQVSRYWGKYRQVLVTNGRDFVLVASGPDGKIAKEETYRLAESEEEFWELAAHPKALALKHGVPFEEFLRRVLLRAAELAEPKDVAWFLASYARAAKARIEHSKLPALDAVRQGLEQSLGLRFEGPKGDHFFRSTFVQTLFYGVFSSWVLWCRSYRGRLARESSQAKGGRDARATFNWHEASWSLKFYFRSDLNFIISHSRTAL